MIRRRGRRGQTSRSFNATTTAYNFGSNNANYNTSTAQTVLILMRPVGAGESNAGYVLARLSAASTDGMRFIVSHNSGNPTMTWGQGSVTASAPNVVTNTGFVTYGKWMWAGATFDGSVTGANMHLYSAGLSDSLAECTYASTTDGSGSIDNGNGLNLYIGNRQGTDRTFNGDIAMVAWWDVVLTLDELEKAKRFGPLTVRRSRLRLMWADGVDYANFREATVTGAASGQPVKYAISSDRNMVFPAFPVAGGAFFIDAQPATFSVTGAAAGLVAARYIDAQPATFSIAAADAGLYAARNINAQPASYTINGIDADLVYTPATGSFFIDAQPASFSITGANAGLIAARHIDAQPASLTVTGVQADLVKQSATAYFINAEPYSMTITAFDATLFTNSAQAAAASVTGGWPTREEYERYNKKVKKARKEPEKSVDRPKEPEKALEPTIPEARKIELKGLVERVSEQYRGSPIERQTAKALKQVHTDLEYDILPSEVPVYEGFIAETLRKREEERIIVQMIVQLLS